MPTNPTRLQQRHVAIASSISRSVERAVPGLSSPSAPPPLLTASPNRDASIRRRRKRSYYHNTIIDSLMSARGRILLFLLTLLAAATILIRRSSALNGRMVVSFSSSTSTLTTPTPPVFQLNSPYAPVCRDLQPSQIDFTLVTQFSHDRLWMMRHHCQRFGTMATLKESERKRHHPMSVAIFSNSSVEELEDELSTLGCNLQHLSVSVVDAHLYPADEYPVNILRNEAFRHVQTSHLIYIDVDFWTSQDLYDTLHDLEIRTALAEDPKLALVIPAFMLFRQCVEYVDCQQNNLPAMPNTKEEVLKMMVQKRGHIFDPTNRGGHGSTLYKEWLRQESGTLLPLPCLQSRRYEPFVVVRYCQDLPPFQTQFTGYGKNKVTWMMQLLRIGYTLSQVGGAFVVHYPHLDSPARTKWNQAPDVLVVEYNKNKKHPNNNDNNKNNNGVLKQIRRPKKSDGNLHLANYKRGQVDQLFVAFREWLDKKVPDLTRLDLCQRGAQDDDSKLWIDHDHHPPTDDENQKVSPGGQQQQQQQQQEQQQKKKKEQRQVIFQKDNTRLEQEAAAAVVLQALSEEEENIKMAESWEESEDEDEDDDDEEEEDRIGEEEEQEQEAALDSEEEV